MRNNRNITNKITAYLKTILSKIHTLHAYTKNGALGGGGSRKMKKKIFEEIRNKK